MQPAETQNKHVWGIKMAATRNSTRAQEMQNKPILNEQMDKDSDVLEIDLVALMYRLIEKWKWLVAAALLGALIFGVYTFNFVTPMYESTAKLYVLNPSDNAIDLTALNTGEKLAADYEQVFNNWHVHEKVISSLNLPYTYKEIQNMLNVKTLNGTRILSITVTSPDPVEAHDIAMAYAEFAPAFIEAKMETDRPNIFEEARVSTKPVSPSKAKNLILGFLLGGILAAGIIVVQFIVDDRIRNAEQLERRLGLAVLGMMPVQGKERKADKKKSGRGGPKA